MDDTKIKLGIVFVCVIAVYLSYHMVIGNRGIISMMHLYSQLNVLDNKYNTLNKEKAKLNHKIHLLDAQFLSHDYLEEHAIENGLAPDDAIVIFDNAGK